MTNPYDFIWLQRDDAFFDTWCQDQIGEDDVRYIRDEWLDVRAQTPVVGQFVLVVVQLHTMRLRFVGWIDAANQWNWYGRGFCRTAVVTHWRPLPDFPAFDDEEE